MRKYIISALVVLLHTVAFSQPVDIEAAKKVSLTLFKNHYKDGFTMKNTHVDVDTNNLKVKSSFVKKYNGHNSYYVTNFVGGGWVITSSHNAVGPILANSPTGTLNENEDLPFVFGKIMSNYDKIIDKAYEKGVINKANQKQWNNLKDGVAAITYSGTGTGTSGGSNPAYLLTTVWGQNYSNDNTSTSTIPAYNNDPSLVAGCSNVAGNHTGNYLAGCGAVAIAQIMKYWGYASGNKADFDWWNMPDQLLYNNNTQFQVQSKAITKLLLSCGSADHLNSTYSCTETTTPITNFTTALTAFGYTFPSLVPGTSRSNPMKGTDFTCNCLTKDGNYNDYRDFDYTQWSNILINEITNKRPILFYTKTTTLNYPETTEYHAFVCDGYNATDGTFHFNFGWNGNENAFINLNLNTTSGYLQNGDFYTNQPYFALSNVTPGTTDYFFNVWSTCIVGIQPNYQQSTTVTIPATTIGTSPLTTNETWQASSIVAGSSTSTAFVVPSADNGRLIAAGSVTLLPGFYAQSGSTFLATIYQNATGGLKDYIETMNEPIASTQNESGIATSDTALTIAVYPNPITNDGNLTLSASKAISGSVQIDIYDIVGQKVFSSTEDGFTSKQLSFGGFAKGIYMLKVTYNNNSILNSKVIY